MDIGQRRQALVQQLLADGADLGGISIQEPRGQPALERRFVQTIARIDVARAGEGGLRVGVDGDELNALEALLDRGIAVGDALRCPRRPTAGRSPARR